MSIYIPEEIAYRRPSHVQMSYIQTATPPHSGTTRATYTIPSGKQGKINYISGYVRRDSNTTSVFERSSVYADVVPVGGTLHHVARIDGTLWKIGDMVSLQLPMALELFSGDRVDLVSIDSNIGGSVTFVYFVRILLWDF